MDSVQFFYAEEGVRQIPETDESGKLKNFFVNKVCCRFFKIFRFKTKYKKIYDELLINIDYLSYYLYNLLIKSSPPALKKNKPGLRYYLTFLGQKS